MTITHIQNPGGIATIALSARIFVQGVFIRRLDEERIVVRVGEKDFAGYPLARGPV